MNLAAFLIPTAILLFGFAYLLFASSQILRRRDELVVQLRRSGQLGANDPIQSSPEVRAVMVNLSVRVVWIVGFTFVVYLGASMYLQGAGWMTLVWILAGAGALVAMDRILERLDQRLDHGVRRE